jgi:hypothetical protein
VIRRKTVLLSNYRQRLLINSFTKALAAWTSSPPTEMKIVGSNIAKAFSTLNIAMLLFVNLFALLL